jgi:hypothetical protein
MIRILGQTGRRRRLALLGTIFTTITLLAVIVVPSAQAVLPVSPSKFESGNDPTLGLGNMVVNTTGNNDWATVSFTDLTDAAASNSDDSFEPGSKQDTACPVVEGHKNPPKDDFTDIASYIEKNTDAASPFFGDTYLYGATIRYAANGNASENIELNQGTGPLCPGSTLESRVEGDKLIAIDYLGGGKAVEFHVLTWVTTGACFVGNHTAPCWGATVLTLDPDEAEGGVNNVDISAADNPISGVFLKAGQFAEFGINLAAAGIVDPDSCVGFTQIVWESRSAGSSFVSSTKDIKIQPVNINSCASVSVRKVGSDGGSQAGAIFTLYEGTGILGTVVGTCTVDANGDCVDPNTGLNPFIGLNPGPYTLDETNTPAGYDKDPNLPFSFTLADGDNLSFEFTNVLQTGAIRIAKTAKHADPDSSPNLEAGFTVTDVDGGTHSVSTDATGNACVDGLPPGDATVSETGPPTGYSAGADQTVTVLGNTTCTGADGVLASFENIPLTNITVSVDSQVDGGTSSTITCGSEPTVTTDPNGDGSLTVNDLEPNVPDGIVCTIVIDP